MERRRMLAGSVGSERVPARPGGDDPRWFEPHHVRAEAAARERIAGQVAAGADVVVAPTWLTHRRALLPVGETRSARAWTEAAVRVARDGVELGLELRSAAEREAAAVESPERAEPSALDDTWEPDALPSSTARPEPLVAASLPALDAEPEPGSGRLLPREAATARDYRDQAGLLADAEPDLILVEGQRSLAEARTAIEEAVATGIPTWVAASGISTGAAATEGDADGELRRLVDLGRQLDVEVVLLLPPVDRAARLVGDPSHLGGLVGSGSHQEARAGAGDPLTSAWLEAGATVIGLLDGASPAALEPVRAAIDAHEGAELAALARSEARWRGHVGRAAAMAPGGAALWLGAPPDAPLPGGFDWLVVDHRVAAQLPSDRFRLVVVEGSATSEVGARDVAALLERGGILAVPFETPIHALDGLRVVSVDDAAEPSLAVLRRED